MLMLKLSASDLEPLRDSEVLSNKLILSTAEFDVKISCNLVLSNLHSIIGREGC